MKLFLRRNLIIVVLVSLICMVAGVEFAAAKKKKKGGGKSKGCRIIIAKKPIPLKVFQKHDGKVLMKWFQSNRTFEVWEKKEEEGKGWDFWILLIFSKPLQANEIEISFYDIEVFPKHLINSFALMLMKKGEKIIPHRVKLSKKEFKANHKYMIQISVKKIVKGEQEFNLRGQGIKYSGEVVFTDEEATGKK